MKHAYLIIAHGDFDVLKTLVEALDDPRNDIYIHFDKKVKTLPVLRTAHSFLQVLTERIDVRWGHFSQIQAEYALFEAVHRSDIVYSYHHLISGTHFPLKSQDYIHRFFEATEGKEILTGIRTDSYEINFKLGRTHLFIRNFRSKNKLRAVIDHFLWRVILKMQYMFGVRKKQPMVKLKAQNWVSITSSAVDALIRLKPEAFSYFKYTFCGDEFLLPFVLHQTPQLKTHITPELLYTEFGVTGPRDLTIEDRQLLAESRCLFARKISTSNMDLIRYLKKRVANTP